MGDVYLARMKGMGEPVRVALKRIRPGLLDEPELVRQFEREARVSSLMSHENIVALRAFGRDASGPYLALEFVDGTSAARLGKAFRSRGQHLPMAAAISIARDVAAALLYAHQLRSGNSEGVIHRDVSPDNVLVSRTGCAKLSDFGIAKMVGATRLTRTGDVKGKYGYIAPELLEGQDADSATDVFAFAATTYFLCCGVPPFRGRTEAEIVRSVLSSVPPRPATLRDGVPPAVDAWITRTLSKRRNERGGLDEFLLATKELSADTGHKAVVDALAAIPTVELRGFVATDAPTGRGVFATAPAKPSHERSDASMASRIGWAGAGVLAVGAAAFGFMALRPPSRVAEVPVVPAPSPHVVQLDSAPLPVPDMTAPSHVDAPPPSQSAEPRPTAIAESGHARPPHHAVSAVRPKPAGRKSEPVVASAAPPTPTAAAPLLEEARPVVPAEGKVWIKVHPWAHVFFDGKPIGLTPIEPFPATPGEHSVILVNEDLKVRRTLTIRVNPGDDTEVRQELEGP
jgi:eukaryotic-like serine/threonine-protein kinase